MALMALMMIAKAGGSMGWCRQPLYGTISAAASQARCRTHVRLPSRDLSCGPQGHSRMVCGDGGGTSDRMHPLTNMLLGHVPDAAVAECTFFLAVSSPPVVPSSSSWDVILIAGVPSEPTEILKKHDAHTRPPLACLPLTRLYDTVR
ncbi:hypothetical protein VOLCADRAFT_106834 [Volvox carteri f. nagariensis]|uniref:Uncharacterized protein n=1 Tax=Volvox carteri f. nagariensis TaxID=3068 RepID=D8UA21_VOLCA|nr:uncharacterized protein VOLCADRAFT_106834 [Volvox carteri f. nagariensis]EFJ43396.1 hypothetical protein VOLCADRAFT_106834 [Volvox carteri f. nagariensis]|eukprot:XP_002955543.1 hypothetical protein VOLCADRAFT_106834 [Volvox carteri f. nagariensis]